jgi:hypothetical protein
LSSVWGTNIKRGECEVLPIGDVFNIRDKKGRKVRNRVTCSLPWDVQKDLAPVRGIENGDADLTLHEDVPSSLDAVVE